MKIFKKLTFTVATLFIMMLANCQINDDSYALKESFNENDNFYFEAYKKQLNPIKKYFNKINSIPKNKWNSIIKRLNDSGEDGEAIYYFKGRELIKIISRNYGKMGQSLEEYYLLDGKIAYIYGKNLKYNRPIYYDSTRMEENEDSQIFDIKKSKYSMMKYYYENGKLIYIYDSLEPSCLVAPSIEYMKSEEMNMNRKYTNLIEILNNN